MKLSHASRLLGLVGIGFLGLAVGHLLNLPDNPVTTGVHASYQGYETVEDLRQGSDAVIRGLVRDSGKPFLDYGLPADEDSRVEGRAVPMRMFSVLVTGPDNSGLPSNQTIQVAVTDADQLGLIGGADLTEGDDVFLFLEAIDNSLFRVAGVDGGVFYVVVGGRQGVFRESTNGEWQQDPDPHLAGEGDETSQDNAYRLRVPLKGLEDASKK